MFVLDTNIVSELRRKRPHGAVTAWLRAIPETALRVSAMTIGELQRGIEITRVQDAARAIEIELWLDRVLATFEIVPIDSEIMRRWARLMHNKSDDLYEDALIAATALVHGLTIVTRNTRDFEAFGTQVLNPFSHQRG